MEFFVILTCSIPVEGGMRQRTVAQIINATSTTTRERLFSRALSQLPPEFAESLNVVFFAAEPNLVTT
jgi:hypothetical protein